MDLWSGFYERLFNFKEIRYFDIKGEYTGLFSRALTSPDGKIRIPINESADEQSQIEEYLHEYKGEGIQHIACGCQRHLRDRRGAARARARLHALAAGHLLRACRRARPRATARIWPGCSATASCSTARGRSASARRRAGLTKVLLQIFSANAIGPIFFEFIQRKGDEGFGEGNFRALFVSIEEDQLRRGVLNREAAAGQA